MTDDAASNGLINVFGSSIEFGNVGTVDGIIGGNVDWSVAADWEAAVAASIKSSSNLGTSPSEGMYRSGNTEK